ncbi:MFS transporter, partial [Pseudomonas sp. TNT11]
AGMLSAWGWRALFLVGAPLGLLAAALACRYLPVDQPPAPLATGARFWRSLQSASLRAGLAMSALVSAVIMATFVVGPFYLSHGLDLDPASMGLAMAVGPGVAAVTGIPAGRLTERFGSQPATLTGLAVMASGALSLCLTSGLVTYLGSLITLTAGYSLFQAANNTAVMSAIDAAHRGTVSGLLNLSRNLGLIFGASVLGAMFAWKTPDLTHATPQSVADGLHATFALALGLILLATAMAWQRQNRRRPT